MSECPNILAIVSIDTLFARAMHANVWRYEWKVIGTARKSVEVKIKRKSFEMSNVSVFC